MQTAHLADASYEGHHHGMYNDAWGQGEPESGDEEASLAKVDRALAMEVNIPLDNKGELVTFREVRQWKMPSLNELTRLKERINNEWIKPLNLKQQDIVRASGLGAPYVCYLLKDPNSPNMNRRRKIEVYSVLTELFRKYDSKIVTKDDFIRLRNQRVANRFQGPRQDRNRAVTSPSSPAVVGISSAGGVNALGKQARRRGRRTGPYGPEDEQDEDDDVSTVDEDLQDSPMRVRRKRRQLYGQSGYYDMNYMKAYFGPVQPANPYNTQPGGGPNVGGGGGIPPYPPQQQPPSVPPQQQYPMPWMPSANVPYWPPHQYVYAYARGAREDVEEGKPFQAPYGPGFPPVVRMITSLQSVVDGPPPPVSNSEPLPPAPRLSGNNNSNSGGGSGGASQYLYNQNGGGGGVGQRQGGGGGGVNGGGGGGGFASSAHDEWIRSKLNKQCLIPKCENMQTIYREPNTHAFVFLIDAQSCLLPIGLRISAEAGASANSSEDLWDIGALRRLAGREDWLSENRDCDDLVWVLWDIKENGKNVQNLFERWKQEYRLTDDELTQVARSFLSQYVYMRDTELAFQTLVPHAPPNEDFTRAIEINCDLVEERIRVKDSFVWDIRVSDWDLTALLSNFVSDFQLDSAAISSLFIDLKITVLRYRKDWVASMLERLTAEGKIDPTKIIPNTLGL